ncbi:MAG: O-antigen ligase family protein [Lachnospiraceae bacterium]|nr:O-antigen ligase family protein [Lachnospiraceae bacterium]
MGIRMQEEGVKIYKIFLALVFVCMTNFFGFYQYLPLGDRLYSNDYLYILIFLASILSLILAVSRNGKFRISGEFTGIWLMLLLLIVVEVFWTYSQYHQPIILTLKEAFYYIVPFVSYQAYLQFKDRICFDEVANVLINVAIISSIVAFIAFFLYTFAGKNVLLLDDSSAQNFRYGTIRFSVGGMVLPFSVIISAVRVMRNQYSKKDIINLILAMLQLILIVKTRTVLLYLIATLLMCYMFEKRTRSWKKFLLVIGIIACVVGALISKDTFAYAAAAYVSSDTGIMIRFQTMSFYVNQFLNHPILGMGLLSARKGIAGSELMYGPTGQYYRSDVGLIGLLVTFGICGLLWVIVFLKSTLQKIRKNDNNETTIIKWCILYLVITLINLSFMDSSRVMYVFILTILAEASIVQEHKVDKKIITSCGDCD